jgi:hypothetical protein
MLRNGRPLSRRRRKRGPCICERCEADSDPTYDSIASKARKHGDAPRSCRDCADRARADRYRLARRSWLRRLPRPTSSCSSRTHSRGGQAQDRAEASGAELSVLAQSAHPGLHRRCRAMGCHQETTGAVVQPLSALRSPAAHPLVGGDARDAHPGRDMSDWVTRTDTFFAMVKHGKCQQRS